MVTYEYKVDIVVDPKQIDALRRFFSQVDARADYGATCIKCNSLYEYAEKCEGFTCWGCRNGY